MATDTVNPGAAASGAHRRPRFFAVSAAILLAIVLLSFPLTYYVPAITGSRRFELIHHLHGAAFFGWFGLYAWQSRLVAKGQVARHRELGLAAFALTGALVPLGVWMAARAAELRRLAGNDAPYAFSWFNLTDIALFGGLMLASILTVTRHREWHRRLTFAAALCLAAPAATRWTIRFPVMDPLALDLFSYLAFYPFLLALALHDRRTLGRVHPATLTCAAVMVPAQLAACFISRSAWWASVGPGLFSS